MGIFTKFGKSYINASATAFTASLGPIAGIVTALLALRASPETYAKARQLYIELTAQDQIAEVAKEKRVNRALAALEGSGSISSDSSDDAGVGDKVVKEPTLLDIAKCAVRHPDEFRPLLQAPLALGVAVAVPTTVLAGTIGNKIAKDTTLVTSAVRESMKHKLLVQGQDNLIDRLPEWEISLQEKPKYGFWRNLLNSALTMAGYVVTAGLMMVDYVKIGKSMRLSNDQTTVPEKDAEPTNVNIGKLVGDLVSGREMQLNSAQKTNLSIKVAASTLGGAFLPVIGNSFFSGPSQQYIDQEADRQITLLKASAEQQHGQFGKSSLR